MEELSKLLKTVVNDGASIGFLPPLDQKESAKYWETVLAPEVILYVAKINNESGREYSITFSYKA